MTLEEAQALLKRIGYRPGYALQIAPSVWDAGIVVVGLTATVMDALNHENLNLNLCLKEHLSVYDLRDMNEEQLVRFVFWRLILELERHEAGEFFTLDGLRPFDPHRQPVGQPPA